MVGDGIRKRRVQVPGRSVRLAFTMTACLASRNLQTTVTVCGDEPHGDYLYTAAWVKELVRELADDQAFQRITGRPPRRRDRRSQFLL